MFVKRKKLQVIDGETLMDLRLEPTRFCVDTLLPQGVCMLSGAAKSGSPGWCWTGVSASPKGSLSGIFPPIEGRCSILLWKTGWSESKTGELAHR